MLRTLKCTHFMYIYNVYIFDIEPGQKKFSSLAKWGWNKMLEISSNVKSVGTTFPKIL